ncbi:TIGR00341 family protein [Chitinophaga sp. Mgbs1]|uniref:TIGR00341 family protein n=1 Tax=Chitinophaga solisilvae TaxID=1233460 RepID=A0A3S1CVL1_9BACT|nr:TIGR00341 family protein [Chitinophaga solisilvae]
MNNKPGEIRFIRIVRLFLERRFNLHIEKADEKEVITSIRKNTEFKGANLWTLIFAIFIASIGLNVNATAVIIGAMLISPLMGPIMGIGLGLGIFDIELLKKGGRNLLIATVISIATSTLYFWITPLHEAQSELLARTTPSVWDVFIAFFGGLAGIVATTRKEKSNVIPGVAIATALMPPLCTAGFGLASGNIFYFLGALYLYFINSVFICLGTFLIIRLLRFKKHQYENPRYRRKVVRYILLIVFITVVPSIYLTLRIVEKSIFENNAQKFVRENFDFRNTQVVNRSFSYQPRNSVIDLLLIGAELTDSAVQAIQAKMPAYHLPYTRLIVRQGLNARQEIDFSQIKASILQDVFRNDSATASANAANIREPAMPDITDELKALVAGFRYYAASPMLFRQPGKTIPDTVMVVMLGTGRPLPVAEKIKLESWIKSRLAADSVSLVLQVRK